MPLPTLKNLQTRIAEKHTELGSLVARSVELVWEIGKSLSLAKEQLDHGQFLPWIEESVPFTQRTAYRYLAVFERFPKGLPEEIDLRQAYIDAGVKKLAAPEIEPDSAAVAAPVVPARDWAKEWTRLSKSPTLSGVRLARYRVAVNPQERVVYALCAGHREPIPISAALLPVRPGTEGAWDEYSRLLQCATEEFLAKIEDLEEQGVIAPPEDHSVLGKHERAKSRIRKEGVHVHQ